MDVRLVRFTVKGGSTTAADAVRANVLPTIREQKGLQSMAFFGDEVKGEYGVAIVWESEDHANTAAISVGPKLQAALEGNVIAPPDIRLFPVIEQ